MYVINRKSKRGGFWDKEAKKVVEKITTESKEEADEYTSNGYKVDVVKKTDDGKKTNKKTDKSDGEVNPDDATDSNE